jgi:hypothetical protein
VALIRLDTIGPTAVSEPLVLVWADVLGQARVRARTPPGYLILMAAAGLIAGLGVINRSSILVVGAMATSPDLLPITAACTGLVLRRLHLAARSVGALTVGLGVAWITATAVTALLNALDLLPPGFTIGSIPAVQTHVGATTILVALTAGVAGMLAVETRASAAVGVGISVTTIPARIPRRRGRNRAARPRLVGTLGAGCEHRADPGGRLDHARRPAGVRPPFAGRGLARRRRRRQRVAPRLCGGRGRVFLVVARKQRLLLLLLRETEEDEDAA